jgi:hypothetical protein
MENMMNNVNGVLATALIGYKDNIVKDYVNWCESAGISDIGQFGIEFEPGSKYVKVVKISSGGSRSVHSFVEKETGNIWKAASWKAPAKNFARGNVFDAGTYLNRLQWTGIA